MAKGFWTGMERASQNLTKTGLNILNYRSLQEHRGLLEQQGQERLGMEQERLGLLKDTAERAGRVADQEQAALDEANMPISIESMANRFEGGKDSPMFKMTYDMVKGAGYIDPSQGGMGTFKRKDQEAILTLMAEPTFVSKLSRTRIDYYRNNLTQIDEQLKEKPEDKKLLTAREQMTTGLNQALGQDDGLQKELSRQEPDKWAPTTKEEAIELKEAGKAPGKLQRKKRNFVKDGKAYTQEYNYNPDTGEETLVGKPYEYKDVGSVLEKWLNKDAGNDPEGIF